MDIASTLLIILLCLLCEGFFSGSEIGVVSADRIKLRHKAAKGSRGAALTLKMLEKPEWLLSVTLVRTNIAVVTNTTIATALMIHLFGENGSWIAIAFATPLISVFGEIVPKSVFQQRADSMTPAIIFVLRFFSYVFYPILYVFSFLTRSLARLTGSDVQNPFTMREEIVTILKMPAISSGDIEPIEQNMIRRMFNFTETTVQKVMLPLIHVAAVEKNISCAEARAISVKTARIRLPVYDQRIDTIVDVLHTLELLGIDPDTPIADHIRPTLYVPATMGIKQLMLEFRKQGTVVAVVVDEFGGAEGIVTMEDIVEEVVENMEDEYDDHHAGADKLIRKLNENDYIANARIEMDALCEQLGIDLPSGRFTTLAGFIPVKAHSVPATGTVIREDGVTMAVTRRSAQAVLEVRIHLSG